MTDFVARDLTHLGIDRIATSATALALYQNLFAFTEKAVGAPVLANSYVVEAMIANSNVSQSKLKSTTGDVATTSGTGAVLTLPGGEYGFYPNLFAGTGGVTSYWGWDATNALGKEAGSVLGVTPIAAIYLSSSSAGTSAAARQRYVQASPPYNLGDGDVPLFVFAMIDNATGNVIATYAAADPPWANNGPTDIRAVAIDEQGRLFKLERPKINRAALADPSTRASELAKLYAKPQLVEITQAVKQADMTLIPHPFQGNDLTGKTVVLMDPVSPFCEWFLSLQESGEPAASLLHEDYVRLDNVPLSRASPPGVVAVAARWRLT